MDSTHLPSVQDIRTEFLGDMASMPHDCERQRDQAAIISSASTSLRESLKRQRKTHDSGHAPLTPNGDDNHDSLNHDSGSLFPVLWQENSFLIPLDSRKSELH
ncbi:hypothetical protein LP416_23430 [Polaromonas sp. P2-4]|nr:hypothetical protein LP416_23430 [Polaromonas sp. P2-4]